jgi:sulfatase maturation enzyme AslB (radical SAM superfamily)
MILSINPTYYCNFRCNFCYLTEEQLSDRKKITLDLLESRVQEAQHHYQVDMVDLYGGEIGLLPESYVNDLCSMLNRNNIDDINIITNLSMVNDVIRNPDFYVTVSYDFDCREQHDRVWNNMFKLEKPFAVLILAGPDLIKKDVDEMILHLNLLANLESVEIKPYSTNQANAHDVTFKDFEEFVKKWIESDMPKNFHFVNEENIQKSLDGTRNAFSNDHVYITPTGKYGVLEFDAEDKEYFLELDTIQEYTQWAEHEPTKNVSDICRSCQFYGKCLTEHYRYVTSLDNGCNGFKGLLEWYNGSN